MLQIFIRYETLQVRHHSLAAKRLRNGASLEVASDSLGYSKQQESKSLRTKKQRWNSIIDPNAWMLQGITM